MDSIYSAVKKMSRYCVLLVVLALLLSPHVSCWPTYHAEFRPERLDYCKLTDEVNELCQRCAKMTQSSMVILMCCTNEEGVMDWCDKYVSYGLRGS